MRTSYSALETYKLCPQKYKFQELDRAPAKKSVAARFGTAIHGALRYLFSRDPLFPTLEEVVGYFRERWPTPEELELTPEAQALYREEGERILRNFYAKNPPWNFSVVDLESRFEVAIEDRRRRETHILAGIIDRIDKTDTGYEVIDYKTTRRMPSQAAVDQNLQLSIYALGLQKRWPHVAADDITLSLYFLKHGVKLSTARSAAAMAATTEDVLGTTAAIQEKLSSGERFEPMPGPHCSVCPYRPICPAWRHLWRQAAPDGPDRSAVDAMLQEYFDILGSQRKGNARLAELKSKIAAYMEAEGYDRVFGDAGYLSRTVQRRYTYDFGKIRAILEPLGRWEEVLTADAERLKAVMKTVPPEVQAEIEAARILNREFAVITANAKRIERPDAPPPPPPPPIPPPPTENPRI